MNTRLVLARAVVLAALLAHAPPAAGAVALQCYNCLSLNSTTCDDPFQASSNVATKCTADSAPLAATLRAFLPPDTGLGGELAALERAEAFEPLCMKVIVATELLRGTFRSCTSLGPSTCEQTKAFVESRGGKVVSCRTCALDRCNAAPPAATVATLLALLALLLRPLL